MANQVRRFAKCCRFRLFTLNSSSITAKNDAELFPGIYVYTKEKDAN